MKERTPIIASGLVVLLLLLWLGFLFHVSPRFAGSFWGGILAVSGAALMLVPLLYLFVKRMPLLRRTVTSVVSMRTLLAWHIYAGIVGPVLVILHTGHKFESVLGITLTALTLLVVLSGFVGRYLMSHIAQEIREKKEMLAKLQGAYERDSAAFVRAPDRLQELRTYASGWRRILTGMFEMGIEGGAAASVSPLRLIRTAEAIADVEYAIRTHEIFKAWFGRWLNFHIVISILLYVLLGLHVWSALHYGIRWFE